MWTRVLEKHTLKKHLFPVYVHIFLWNIQAEGSCEKNQKCSCQLSVFLPLMITPQNSYQVSILTGWLVWGKLCGVWNLCSKASFPCIVSSASVAAEQDDDCLYLANRVWSYQGYLENQLVCLACPKLHVVLYKKLQYSNCLTSFWCLVLEFTSKARIR
jgi:hypothetical protein